MRIIEHTNLAYVEPHRVIIKDCLYLFFNEHDYFYVKAVSYTHLEVFRYGKMYSTDSVGWHALNPLQLFTRHVDIGADTSMYFCIGVPLLFGLILIPFVRKKKENYKDYCFFFVVGIISVSYTHLMIIKILTCR